MNDLRVVVFEQETSEYGVAILSPVKVPKEINIDNVGEWLPTLYNYANHCYTVMLVSEIREYAIKERPKVLYAESVKTM